ncbi:MAG: glycoside hydrolase family 31 protein [Clostridia bacterium]
MLSSSGLEYIETSGGNLLFSGQNGRRIILSFPDPGISRIRIIGETGESPSIMVDLGFVKEKLAETAFDFSSTASEYILKTGEIEITIGKRDGSMQWLDKSGSCFLKTPGISSVSSGSGNLLCFNMDDNEHFYGFGFQRKVFDARGSRLTFTKGYRWDEATVPFFMSTAGYGFFSANTFDQTFDFTKSKKYLVSNAGGNVDFFIIHGPGFKEILDKYTDLTGKPVMVPKWSLGLCYIARVFEDEHGLMDIAARFRSEGIPCDMLGLEPGWEESYYSMKWIWSGERFPNPGDMIERLHSMGYAIELWESGDAPTEGYLNPETRRKWFSERVPSSLGLGIDFFKQDDPYPRCITSTEMVTDPTVGIFIKHDDGHSPAETGNIANTLYSKTVFDEFRRITGRRTIVIFHSYNASISSQMYPTAWAGDFKLGNGALNASLSGHAMVTHDMRNESPAGIHFGFLTPYSLIDSWATYREPWLFSKHNEEITRFYSRLRSALFPYLYTALWQSHTKGLPILRPMVLEFQNDPNTHLLDGQFMLGDCLLVGTPDESDPSIYLPRGKWIDYWTRKVMNGSGQNIGCSWPEIAGGPLYVKSGSIIPMTVSADSSSLRNPDFLILDIYPEGRFVAEVYEDDGVSFDYENGGFTLTKVECHESDGFINITAGKPSGSYAGMPSSRALLFRIFSETYPIEVVDARIKLNEFPALDALLGFHESGWYFDNQSNALYIKPHSCWKMSDPCACHEFFHNAKIEWLDVESPPVEADIRITAGTETIRRGISAKRVQLDGGDLLLFADGESSIDITAEIRDENGLIADIGETTAVYRAIGPAIFENGSMVCESALIDGRSSVRLLSTESTGCVMVSVEIRGLQSESITIEAVRGKFEVVLNPPERVRLNLGDNWLPYYMFANIVIVHGGRRICSACPEVHMDVIGNDDRDIARSYTTIAKRGLGRFEKAILGSPTEPPDVVLRFSSKGVDPVEIVYCLHPNHIDAKS